jgi:hypothetical protein
MHQIIYIAFVSKSHTGVVKKIESQREIWRTNGANVFVKYDLDFFSGGLRILNRYLVLIRYFIFNCNNDRQIIYFRQTQSLPLMGWITKCKPFCYEVNALSDLENLTIKGIKGFFLRLLKDKITKNATAVFYVSDEIKKKYNHRHLNGYVLPNSLSTLPAKKVLPRKNNIVFVGTDKYDWQGVDLVNDIARNLSEFQIHMVGEFNNSQPLPNQVFYGVLQGSDYETLMSKMDYGIGTLAFHRSGLKEGSALKVRDYISFNLPVISGYYDSDFSGKSFYLNVYDFPTVERIWRIRKFISEWRICSITNEGLTDVLFEQREQFRLKLVAQESSVKILK